MWNWDFAIKIFPEIFAALKITVIATFAGFFLALFLGMFLTIGSRSSLKPVAYSSKGFVEFIRSTPLLVQLYFIFYVLPQAGLSLSPLTAGIMGLGIHYSTYLSEVYRSGIEAIPQGQWEAAKALNFSPWQVWAKIIIPQAVPPVIPVMGNYLITMFKETPLLSAITLVEILQTAKIIGSHSFRYLEGFTIVGLLFLLLSYPCSVMIRRLEMRMTKSVR
ncbi:ectoine/hydroxyectoine ABC transporter permease subunit EhuD [Desulfitobacterium chlororespirans]|uniref:Amino acid ABC transporter membrane protein 2, PAAT family n=1 Tax=Desulfitobacterium chlororespirans DSM 11544 TaxID=1121395 RepID=A0A1M7RUK7_9FIRM|nr:ectoine/hydroxyectoine ABC transporter permease subunit EhuD [Desulfitobacterium chlororespirans]SHN49941.1 amino acid ABC transporter membrane protein 2, PAAT family [Desulfitobacterium chlororespirans DSM 11544]